MTEKVLSGEKSGLMRPDSCYPAYMAGVKKEDEDGFTKTHVAI